MLAYVKKIHRHSDDLLHLALILSLIRVDPESYLGLGLARSSQPWRNFHNVSMGDVWAHSPSDLHSTMIPNIPDVPYLHPKSMEASLALYQEELIEELNDLGRYTRILPPSGPRTIEAYLLNETSSLNHEIPTSSQVNINNGGSILGTPGSSAVLEELRTSGSQGTSSQVDVLDNTSELSAEDADLIEILWKQDIDIGIPRDHFLSNAAESPEIEYEDQETVALKVKQTKDKCEVKDKSCKDDKKDDAGDSSDDDPWAGLAYRVDDETGEYILLENSEVSSDSGCETNSSQLHPLPDSKSETAEEESDLDNTFGYVDLAPDAFGEETLTESNFTLGASGPELVSTHDPVLCSIAAPKKPRANSSAHEASEAHEDVDSVDEQPSFDDTDLDLAFFLNDVKSSDDEERPSSSGTSSPSAGRRSIVSPTDSIEELSAQLEASLEDMIQTAQMHPRSLQVRMPLMRTMSMEHRWQDLANFLSLPDGAAAAAAAANLGSHPGHHHGHPAVHHSHHATHHGMHSLGHHSPHPFVHPGYATHGSVHHHNASPAHHGYGVHPAASHHAGYGGLPSAAAPVSAYPNTTVNAGADVNGRSALLQNASIASPLADIGSNGTYPTPNLAPGITLGSAVTASMNLTNSTDSLESNSQVTYKTEVNDMHLYYQNNNSEVNQNGDGFFPSIFNEDDLNLMDMAITDSMYTPRMLENQTLGHNVGLPGANNNSVAAGVANAVIDTTNDSAVSSMGSDRGHSISEGDWLDNTNAPDSNTSSLAGATAVLPTVTSYGMEFSKYRHYEYSGFNSRSGMDGVNGASRGGNPPVAQKKHQMFGKRIFQEQGEIPGSPSVNTASSPAKFEYGNGTSGNGPIYSHPSTPLDASSNMSSMDMKYGCGLDFNVHAHDARGVDHVAHNHTYALGAEASGSSQRPVSRDKPRGASTSSLRSSISESASTPGAGTSGSSSESEAYSRDEKRARAMNIPMTVDDIINLPMDEFNERLSKYDLTEAQLSLIRDIRRRGKNKVAAQNCRKRKLDQILTLADEVKRARERKSRLLKEREFLMTEKAKMKDRFAQLYRHVFQSLRDPDGQPYSSYEYSLQQSADGNILLVPRAAAGAHGGTPIDPQPTLHSAIQHSSQHQPMQLHHHHMSGQRQLIDTLSMNIPGTSCNVNGSATSVVHHGARRKTPDHRKNEP